MSWRGSLKLRLTLWYALALALVMAAYGAFVYARLLAWNGRDAELALALVTDALSAVPDEPRWLDTKAECLSRLGRYDEAIVVESRAVEKAQRLEDRAEFGRALYEMKKRRAEAAGGARR